MIAGILAFFALCASTLTDLVTVLQALQDPATWTALANDVSHESGHAVDVAARARPPP